MAGTEPVAAGFVERIIFEKINHMMVKIVMMMMMMMIMSGMHCMAAQLSWWSASVKGWETSSFMSSTSSLTSMSCVSIMMQNTLFFAGDGVHSWRTVPVPPLQVELGSLMGILVRRWLMWWGVGQLDTKIILSQKRPGGAQGRELLLLQREPKKWVKSAESFSAK